MKLGLLDKSPQERGEGATEALARTVRLARDAERLGFHRFWFAEHHGTKQLTSSAPEILIAHVLAKTTRIRVGAGGIMLQHYSAYKVAEVFRTLAALAPGRVDLGIGKAPGGFPFSTRALQDGRDRARWPDFAEQVAQLDFYLGATFEKGEPTRAVAAPVPPAPPERFLLGGSVESAELAAERGWNFVFAGHMNGDPALTEKALSTYVKKGGRGKALLATFVLVSDKPGEAEARVDGLAGVKLRFKNGHAVNLGNREQAAEYARQAGEAEYEILDSKPGVIAGTPEKVCRALEALTKRFDIEELIVEIPLVPTAVKEKSVALLGAELGASATV